MTSLLAKLNSRSLERLYFYFNEYPGCLRPDVDDWKPLDSTLQQVKFLKPPAEVYLIRVPVVVDAPDLESVAWGNTYPHGSYDGRAWRLDLERFLSETVKKQAPRVQYFAPSPGERRSRWFSLNTNQ